MHHLRTISRERPALAQGGGGILSKVSQILAIVELFVFIRDEILGKAPEEPTE